MQLGRYELLAPLGQGGAGTVYRARDDRGEIVAIKLLRADAGADTLGRFRREKRLLESFGAADGFVPLLDGGEEPQPYLVMPLIAGGTLRERVRRGPLPVREVVRLGARLARAMQNAHAKGVVHRDLKPENILFTRRDDGQGDGEPLVADLGLAKHWKQDAPGSSLSVALTRDGAFCGTAGYMAPEQMLASSQVGPTADVFSLGAILFECLTGESPFEAPSVIELLARIESGEYTPLQKLRPDTPRWLARAIERALERDPARRFADASGLLRALETGDPAGSRRPARGALGAVLLVGVGVALGLALPRLAGAPPSPPPRVEGREPAHGAPGDDPGAPAWFGALPAAARPPLPLPAGMRFGPHANEYTNEKDGSVLLWVPPGTFTMGTEDGLRDERPAHEVELSGYWIGRVEVTNVQFGSFVAETGYLTIAERQGVSVFWTNAANNWATLAGVSWRDPFHEGKMNAGDHPVVHIGWHDARAYCEWAKLRLPTEAQWERAALWDPAARRARKYAWGDVEPGDATSRFANLRDVTTGQLFPLLTFIEGHEDGFARTAPVGSFPDGASPSGALDMTGNAWEWTADGYDPRAYETLPRKDPFAPPERFEKRVARGGSWNDMPDFLRGTKRHGTTADDRCDSQGFRVAR